MIRILLATLASAMPCRPHQELGRAVVLFAFEGTYRFDGGKSISFGWLNSDQVTRSGQCRVTLTPT